MTDLISRQEAIDGKILIQRANGVEIYSDEVVPVEYLKRLSSVYPKKGKWIPRIGLKHPDWFTCSECTGQFDYKWKYCPNCGADMRGN